MFQFRPSHAEPPRVLLVTHTLLERNRRHSPMPPGWPRFPLLQFDIAFLLFGRFSRLRWDDMLLFLVLYKVISNIHQYIRKGSYFNILSEYATWDYQRGIMFVIYACPHYEITFFVC
jgi:hypothetical protein